MKSKKIIQMNLFTKQKQIVDMEGRLLFARGMGEEKGMDREFGAGRCRLLHLEEMGDGILLYSTWN